MMKQISAIALLGILAFGSIALAQKSANSAPQMKENMRPKQALRMELYVYETRLSGDPKEMVTYLPEHLEYQLELERKGIMFGAGPLFEQDKPKGPPVAGMIIIRADSMEHARKIADADPMHKAGVRSYTLRKWFLNEGSLEVSLKFSAQDFELD